MLRGKRAQGLYGLGWGVLLRQERNVHTSFAASSSQPPPPEAFCAGCPGRKWRGREGGNRSGYTQNRDIFGLHTDSTSNPFPPRPPSPAPIPHVTFGRFQAPAFVGGGTYFILPLPATGAGAADPAAPPAPAPALPGGGTYLIPLDGAAGFPPPAALPQACLRMGAQGGRVWMGNGGAQRSKRASERGMSYREGAGLDVRAEGGGGGQQGGTVFAKTKEQGQPTCNLCECT